MKFNTQSDEEAQKCYDYISELIQKQTVIEVLDKRKRSLNQNAYLHLIIGWLAVQLGESIEYVKTEIYKKEANKALFSYWGKHPKTGNRKKYLKSSAKLTSSEMTSSIDRFRNLASGKYETYLPAPNEDQFLRQIEVEIEKNKEWL